MPDDPYSLTNLRGIVLPDPPSLWPLAPGMWVVLGILAAVVLASAWYVYAARQRNAYRRAGLALLREARTAHDVAVVLKRVALAAFPREQVASLYGANWAAFLKQTCGGHDFTAIVHANVGGPAPATLIQLAEQWIRYHRTTSASDPNR